ncbi:hypothetical protein GON04_11770 [Ramlibacter sp. MAH-25]|uniref:Uncharacterized protein n=2 Tax=Comamonadaceae TaxID=80864 RepID=A0A6N8IT89_9BURK|nr:MULTISPECIES: hypothetical protein [Ramlibacter]MBA2965166.1 hypothetical protein [Ramlibacter sp. CGMCC 1.13660]MVQ30131.1 hypothetical protein [Ramlibacter pinisoli]
MALAVFWIAKARLQRQRITVLARFLSGHSIEKNIETLTEGYLRALGEADPGRRDQVWALLRTTEQALCEQMRQLAHDFATADPAATRVSKLPIWLPLASAFAGSFDMREALRVHARGICRAVDEEVAKSAKDRAFAITAEMLLMQHTCHWFCRSKSVASARMLARHRTSYEQLVGAVLPQTRSEYLGLVSLARGA